jgi:hypothetical protein
MTKHKSKKKFDIATICKNTLLVCSAITALGGAVGGLKEQFMGSDGKPDKTEAKAPAAPTTIIIEQRAAGDGRHMSKTVRVETGGVSEAAVPVTTAGDTPDSGEALAADMVVGSAAPQSSLTGWKLPWGWMLSIGLLVVGGIIMWEKWTRRKLTIQTKETT